MTENRHASSCRSARDLCQPLREGEFPVPVVGDQCAVQQNQAFTQAHQPRATPALQLLRKIGAVAEEDLPRIAFLLHEGVDVTTLAQPPGQLHELARPPLQREHEANGVDTLFAHAG